MPLQALVRRFMYELAPSGSCQGRWAVRNSHVVASMDFVDLSWAMLGEWP